MAVAPTRASQPAAAPRRPLLTHHLPAVLWMVAMTVALAVPSSLADLPSWWPRVLHFQALDKVIHGGLFLVAALLWVRSVRCLGWRRPLWTVLVLLAFYGAATEVGQQLFTDRDGEAMDAAADAGGAALGVLLSLRRRGTPATGGDGGAS